MKVTQYTDTKDTGNSVLIADNGKVAFLIGQPRDEELVKGVLEAVWSDADFYVKLADDCKGDVLAEIVTELGQDMSDSQRATLEFFDGLGKALINATEEIDKVLNAGSDYRKATAMALIAVDKYDEVRTNTNMAKRDLECSPPIINVLVRMLEADRFVTTQALIKMLSAQRNVVAQLQSLGKGAPDAAHVGVLALLETMGMPLDGCPCCGEDHEAPGANASKYEGRMHMPGSSRVN